MRVFPLASATFALASTLTLPACSQAQQSDGGPEAAIVAATAPTQNFNDCGGATWCPQLAAIPGGDFVMGSPKNETGRFDDEDQHLETVAAFAIGKFPVTRGQWAAFTKATNRPTPQAPCAYSPAQKPSWQNPGFAQTDDHPVVCVSWPDARDYVRWLSQRTGQQYRLPTDAEREYAARAGTKTPFPWGADASHERANYGLDECCGTRTLGRDRWEHTSPVGSFPPNQFGLYDMHGNVFEWLETCADGLEGLPLDPDAKGCTYRFARGGDFGDRPHAMRSAARNFAPPPGDAMTIANYRSAGFGFRVARSLQ